MTRNDEDLFALLAALRRRYPQWRFGQLVSNLAGWADVDIWDVEDEQLIDAAKLHLDYSANRKVVDDSPARVG